MNTPILELRNLSKSFGSVVANKDVSLSLERGEVLALLGENGAGKTTLMNLLFGHYLPDAGAIHIADAAGKVTALPLGAPQMALQAGIGMVHQHFTLALNLSVLDNILLGSERLTSWRRNRRAARDQITALMERSGLRAPLDTPVSRLTVGERQRVEILKALYRDVRILVLDEPTAVLTPQEADVLFASLREMVAGGLSVIFISHKLHEVLAFSDRIAVLRHGALVGEMVTADADKRKIAEMMMGAERPVMQNAPNAPGAPVVTLSSVSAGAARQRGAIRDVDLSVRSGEIVGIAGVSGNGQTQLAQVLAGISAPTSGEMHLGGKPVARFTPRSMAARGVGHIPEDRHHDGVVGTMSVAENLVLDRVSDKAFSTRGILKRAAMVENARETIAAFDVRGPGAQAAAQILSGGNIQKLILARVLASGPTLIIANQPTRGLDVGAASDVGQRLIDARNAGAGVVLISEDLDEILTLSDSICVMFDGTLRPVSSRDRADIGLAMAGHAA